jgi:hypothetical protein
VGYGQEFLSFGDISAEKLQKRNFTYSGFFGLTLQVTVLSNKEHTTNTTANV